MGPQDGFNQPLPKQTRSNQCFPTGAVHTAFSGTLPDSGLGAPGSITAGNGVSEVKHAARSGGFVLRRLGEAQRLYRKSSQCGERRLSAPAEPSRKWGGELHVFHRADCAVLRGTYGTLGTAAGRLCDGVVRTGVVPMCVDGPPP